MTLMFNIGFGCYLVALVLAAVNTFHSKRGLSIGSVGSILAGVLVQTVYIAVRWAEAGRAPFSNMFESLVLFAWTVAVVYLALRIRMHIPILEAATALLAVLGLAYASTFEQDIRPLMPALQSNWLSVHVFTCFLGYGGFAVSFVSSIGYLVVSRKGAAAGSELQDSFDSAMAKTISFGFLFLTIGIITGSVWANSAWGTYWSWDPKETWSLITWLIYAGFLHCRFMRGWKGRRAAWISIVGFMSVLFTYVGVNFLLSGLHSYA